MSSRMSLTLFKNVPSDRVKEIESRFIENEDLLQIVRKALEDKGKEAFSKQLSSGSYDSPSWGYYQADLIGYQRALKEICDLLSIKQE